jgi:outer membrane protein OmpA-like peptidoglycan-associated protein
MIEGHTDSDGSNVFKSNLSENRAAAVRNYLVEKGIGTDRLKSTDLVKLNQLFPTEQPQGKLKIEELKFL